MRKKNLTLQIASIFVIAFIATYTLLAWSIVSQLDDVFESNVFDQLESQGKELVTIDENKSINLNSEFAYILYSSNSNVYRTSNNINDFVNKKYSELLINKASSQINSISRFKNLINNQEIYYVILNYENFLGVYDNDVFIILTDNSLKKDMVKETAIQILLACLFAYLLGYLVIYLWTNKLVRDTKKIAKSLHNIGENHYKTKLQTSRKDEIGDLVKSIEKMREKIIDSEKHKQEIIQGVSHDLKTPIAIIQSYAEALEDDIYSKEEVSQITLKQCNRLNDKVRKLLTLTRIGYLDMNYKNFGETDMDQLVNDITTLYKGKSSVDIINNIEPVKFIGDEDSWRIVLENLMDNAIRYAKSKIIITISNNQLSVYNDGISIPKEKIDNIFNAYEKGNGGNYGLGLSIVKRTLNLFGYNINVANVDDGVKFTIQ